MKAGQEEKRFDFVIGWVLAVGTEPDIIKDSFKEEFSLLTDESFVWYDVKIIDLIKKYSKGSATRRFNSQRYYAKVLARQECGNNLRKEHGNDVLARMAISEISDFRGKSSENKELDKYVNVFSIHSLKHSSEAQLLRELYGDRFVMIGVNASHRSRLSALQKKCNGSADRAHKLIRLDYDEADEVGTRNYSQQVRQLFEACDVYFDIDKDKIATYKRTVQLLMGHLNIAPTLDEVGSCLAARAAEQSQDLSRQVGAAMMNHEGCIVAIGHNDVPKAGGGLYSGLDPNDVGDRRLGYDPGEMYRLDLAEEITRSITENLRSEGLTIGWLQPNLFQALPPSHEKLIVDGVLQSAARNIVEFGRSVHAEMDLLSSCARLGISTKDSTVYVTTFPCHTCARHLIAAGVKRVVYVEPYPKSRALQLYADSIECRAFPESVFFSHSSGGTIDQSSSPVRFEPLSGIGPRRFTSLFSLKSYAGRKLDRKRSSGVVGQPEMRLFGEASEIIDYEIDENNHSRRTPRIRPRTAGLIVDEQQLQYTIP